MKHLLGDSFNFLTTTNTDKGLLLTGETKEGIDIGDDIMLPWKKGEPVTVQEVIERRDSKDYPPGNNYFYRVFCA